jgi:hypothetical protein
MQSIVRALLILSCQNTAYNFSEYAIKGRFITFAQVLRVKFLLFQKYTSV